MKHTNRLVRHYVDEPLHKAQSIVLGARSANYLSATLRMGIGARVVLFDGMGTERWATISALGRGKVELALAESTAPQPPSPLTIHLIQALAKGEAMDAAVQKATELGVARILPVTTQYSVVKLPHERRQRRLAHWFKVACSACEQCGRHYPPKIEALTTLAECLDALQSTGPRMLLEPGAEQPLSALASKGVTEITLLVGPEGGLSATDLGVARQHGFLSCTLGPRILRTDTAAMAACAVLQSLCGDLK